MDSDLEATLIDDTGKNAREWMNWIGQRIALHTNKTTNRTESDQWLHDLADAVYQEVVQRFDLATLDENIICARLVSIILTLWTSRIMRAKSHDPRRPVELRRMMMEKREHYHHNILTCLSDESSDREFFPAQEWESPFLPEKGEKE